MLNCFDTTPYQNQLAIADVPGKVLLDALEFSTRNIEKSDFGGFLQPSGIKFDVNTNMVANIVEKNDTWQPLSSNPDNYRVNNVKIYNKRNECYEDLDLNKTYKVAGLDYYFKNYGDGYLMFRNADVKVKSYTDISATMLKEYLQNFKKANGEELAHINSKNSPLYGIKDFGVNYENKYGSGRINIK